MNNSLLLQTLHTALQADTRLWSEEGELNRTKLMDLLEKYDESVLAALLANAELNRHFFAEVAGVRVFKLQDFRFFLHGSKIDNAYTQYANRIGLTDGSRFLKDSRDIVLDFPFKDCLLNGGQSSEEGEEVYFERNKDNQQPATSNQQPATSIIRKENAQTQRNFLQPSVSL